MKTLLVALNSKYIHFGLAVRILEACCKKEGIDVSVKEFTINQNMDYMLDAIYCEKPDVLVFSCYIWNIELVKQLIAVIKKILPAVKILLGGPEVSYNAGEILEKHPVDAVISGPGEEALTQVLKIIKSGGQPPKNITGKALPLHELPFVYRPLLNSETEEFRKKIIYYESSRGCPYGCSYCLCSADNGPVDYLPLERVFSELQFFIDKDARQVKFVDRTFNCNKKRAAAIWSFLMERDRGRTNFHFEIGGDLLDESSMELLKSARPGLFQFEIGIQSFNEPTLQAAARCCDLEALCENIKIIKSFGNIHQHLDLIAGLPYETYELFKESFNRTYALQPEQLQLGFLKILKGSTLEKKVCDYGIVCQDKAPYEALYTNWISYDDMLRLKAIEAMAELYYNSGRCKAALAFGVQLFESSFGFFEALAKYWKEQGHHHVNHDSRSLYLILNDFLTSAVAGVEASVIRDFLKYDMLIMDRVWPPDWMKLEMTREEKEKSRQYAKDREGIWKAEKFQWDIRGWLKNGRLCPLDHVLVFFYQDIDPFTGKVRGKAEYLEVK